LSIWNIRAKPTCSGLHATSAERTGVVIGRCARRCASAKTSSNPTAM
jgi:hypothetical protein